MKCCVNQFTLNDTFNISGVTTLNSSSSAAKLILLSFRGEGVAFSEDLLGLDSSSVSELRGEVLSHRERASFKNNLYFIRFIVHYVFSANYLIAIILNSKCSSNSGSIKQFFH